MDQFDDVLPVGMDRRKFLRASALTVGGLSLGGLLAACSTGTDSGSSTSTGGTGGIGAPTTTRPTDKFVASSTAGDKSPLAAELGLCLVTVQGAIKQFADAATGSAASQGLKTSQSTNDGNTAKAISQLNQYLQRKVGAVFVQDLTPSAQEPVIKNAIDQGMATFSFNMVSHLQMTASQYEIGKQLAQGTLDYIKQNLNNQAKLVHFNFDYNAAVAPRDQGWREVMKGKPSGVQIVADVPINPESQEKGNQVMASILQKTPDVNVVDGGDTGVLGALAALRAAGRGNDSNLALFGVNGDPQAVAEVQKGGPYKATYAFNFAVLGVLLTDMSNRWLGGLNIPQLAVVPAVKIDSADSITAYNQSVADPAAAYKSGEGKYFNLFGSTSYATRGTYFNGKVT